MKISIYGHSGSYNHGNEAIVRGICSLLPQHKIRLYSFTPTIDVKFGLDEVCEIKTFFKPYKRYAPFHFYYTLWKKLTKNNGYFFKPLYKSFFKEIEGVYLLEAGDQYCESKLIRQYYAFLNKEITRRGGKTVMLGCTINQEFLEEEGVIEDLKRYHLIVARESITYKALLSAGVNKNTHLAPDLAFLMEAEPCEKPLIFDKEVVGINAGFLKQGNEIYYEKLVQNNEVLIKYILENTPYNIALIPHVNWNTKDTDFNTLNALYEKFKDSGRIAVLEENSAPRQKYLMSQCKFMIALRTHVAIPSIASKVPTLVTGYKVKSTGIINDIFPEDFKLLAHVGSLTTDNEFVEHFKWMIENEKTVKAYFESKMQEYIAKIKMVEEKIIQL
jgi:polysaccharide pyruvyl transferase WcaK-like protein